MSSAGRLLSVNVGTPVDAEWAPGLHKTAIIKHRVEGRVKVHTLGVEGDEVADKNDHGGPWAAVYAFAREDLDLWSERLDRPIPDGQFGENLTTSGIDVNEARLGEQWQIGSVVVEVVDVRIPCSVFSNYMRVSGFDHAKWVKRFTQEGRPGPYLKVVQEGELAAGDDIVVVRTPDHDITVSMAFRALTTERSLLPRLLEVGDGLAPALRDAVDRLAARA